MISLSPIGNKWELEESYSVVVSNKTIKIKKGFVTDLASVPRLLWWLIPPFGKYTEAAVVHDFLYLEGKLSRKKCDEIFLSLMLRSNTDRFIAKVLYCGVRIFGWLRY